MKSKLLTLLLALFICVPCFGAVDFDGVDDYVSVGSDAVFNGPTNMSVCAWVNPDDFGARAKVVSKGSDVGSNRALYTWEMTVNTNQTARMGFSDGADPVDEPTSTGTLTAGKWHHLCGTYDGSTALFYLDGSEDGSSSNNSGQLNTETGVLHIGRDNNAGTGADEFDGSIDDLRVYDRALSATEVAILANSPKRSGGILDWKSNLTATDDGSGGNDGTLTNSPLKRDDADCQIKTCLDFDGTNDYVSIPDTSDLTFGNGSSTDQPFSVSAWVNMDDATSFRIMGKGDDASSGRIEWVLGIAADDYMRMQLYDNIGSAQIRQVADATSTADEGTWTHFVGTYDASKTTDGIIMYRNGSVLASTGATSGSYSAMHNTNKAATIGAFLINDDAGYDTFSNGKIDDVRVYTDVLTSGEVTYLSSKGASGDDPTTTNLIGHWTLDDVGPGLVAHYEMDDKEIGHVAGHAQDDSGNANHGTFTGFANLVSGSGSGLSNDVPSAIGHGTSLEFDGTDDYIVITDTSDHSFGNGSTDNPFSITAWINMDDATKFRMVTRREASGENEWQFITSGTDELFFSVLDDSTSAQHNAYSTAMTANEGSWKHVAGTYSGVGGSSAKDGLTVYIDGVDSVDARSNSGGTYTAMENTASNTWIGQLGAGLNDFANGKMDDVRIYDDELTSGEVTWLSSGGASGDDPGTANLVSHYKLDDSAVKDISGNDNHGVGSGAPTHSGNAIQRN